MLYLKLQEPWQESGGISLNLPEIRHVALVTFLFVAFAWPQRAASNFSNWWFAGPRNMLVGWPVSVANLDILDKPMPRLARLGLWGGSVCGGVGKGWSVPKRSE